MPPEKKSENKKQTELVVSYGEVCSDSLLDWTLQLCREAADTLERKASGFPDKDKMDVSKELLYESSYAEKEELERDLASRLRKLRAYLAAIDREKKRCRRNLAKIAEDNRRLQTDGPSQYYDDAERREQGRYHSAVYRQKEIEPTVVSAEAVLKASRAKKFPGDHKPKKVEVYPTFGPSTGGSTLSPFGGSVPVVRSLRQRSPAVPSSRPLPLLPSVSPDPFVRPGMEMNPISAPQSAGHTEFSGLLSLGPRGTGGLFGP